MRALVTGAGGFSGRHLVRFLEQQGVAVHAVPRGTNVGSAAELGAVAAAARPDYVVHLAGVAAGDDLAAYYSINTAYAAALLQGLAQAGLGGVPVLLAGTSAEYGMIGPHELPIVETQAPRPYNHYGASKLAQTTLGMIAAAHDRRRIVVARTFNLLGAGMPPHLAAASFARQIRSIQRGEQAPVIAVGNLESTRDFVDVQDAVRIYWQLITTPAAYGETVNVCTGAPISIRGLLDALIAASGLAIEVKVDAAKFKPVDVPAHYGSTEKLERLIGAKPTLDLAAVAAAILDDGAAPR